MLFLYEIKKLYKNKVFLILLILFLILDLLSIFNICKDYISDDANVYKMEIGLTDTFEGKLTKEKVDLISNNYNRLSEIIDNNEYSTEYDESTYTGYQMMDYNVFSELNYELSRIYNFNNAVDEKIEEIQSAMKLYKENGNIKSYNQYDKIVKAITHRSIDEIHNYKGVNKYINYDLSVLFVIILSIFIAVSAFSSDKEMVDIVYTASRSKKSIFSAKILSIVFNVCTISIVFFALDLLMFKLIIGVRGINSPLYYLEDYSMTYFNGSILMFSIVNMFGKMICSVIISLVCCGLTTIIRKSTQSMIASVIVFAACLNTTNIKYNPLNLIYLRQDFMYPSFCGTLSLGYSKILVWFVISVAIALLVYLIQRRIMKYGNIKI